MIYTYQHGEDIYTINLEPQADGTYTATIGEATYSVQVRRGADGGLLLEIDGERHRIHTATNEDQRYVAVNGETYTLAAVDPAARRRKATGPSGDLTAQMPGQVVEVLVDEGETVESGQTLVILEAMKMEIRVSAPADGVVKQVSVVQGDVVERGQVLIELGDF
jgi:3-methylcrotonyl-CoA carboxylase alpha subunit